MTSSNPILLTDDLVVEEPNPYRRRQRVIGVRRGVSTTRQWVKRVTIGLLLPVALFFSLRWAIHSVMTSPLLQFQPARDIDLAGNHVVSRDDVLNAIGYGDAPESLPASMLRINLSALRRRVESIRWVESATVTRAFPCTLLVTIVERAPIAYANLDGHIELVDKDGVFLAPGRQADPHFTVLYGLDSTEGASERKARLEPYKRFLAETKGVLTGSGWRVSEADLSNPDDLRVLLVRGSTTVLAHFGNQDYEQRLRTFTSVAPEVLASNPRIDSMDLRFSGEVVVDPGGKASGAVQSASRPTKTN